MKKAAVCAAFLRFGAGNETRTRDPNLGKVVLYQLSYSRAVIFSSLAHVFSGRQENVGILPMPAILSSLRLNFTLSALIRSAPPHDLVEGSANLL